MIHFPILTAIVLTPVLACVATLLIPAGRTRVIKVVNGFFAAISLGLAIGVWSLYDATKGGYQLVERVPWVAQFHIFYYVGVDGISVVLVTLNAIVFLTGVLTMWRLETRVKEYFAFMALLVAGVFGVFISLDLVVFFFFYEVAVLPMYPLIAVWGSTRKEYSAMKLTLYLMGGSALLFPGLIALFWLGGAHTWSIPALAHTHFSRHAEIFLYPFLYVGFGILAGMWPFHGWSPTGHVAAPTAVSMLHAGVLMKLGAYGILRIAMTILPQGAIYWMVPFAALATVNIIYGAFVAMRQTDFKYVIGFSSVSHMGIVLLGLNTLGVIGVSGAVFQMFAHGVMTALFFSAVGFIYDQSHDRNIEHFGGLARQVPVAATFFILAGICGMGVPGFASFWAELLVFIGAIETFPWLGAIAIVGLVLTAAYILRVFAKAMFGAPNPRWSHLVEPTPFEAIPRLLLIGVLVVVGFFPNIILDLVEPAVRVLLPGGH